MFGKRKRSSVPPLDTTGKIPIIRSSICTGEKVAGFKNEESGQFTEVMLIRTEADYQEFLHAYRVNEADIRREW